MNMEPAMRQPYKTARERGDCAPLHPGEILREDLLPYYGLSTPALASLLGISGEICGELIAEKQDITADLAHRLGSALNFSAHYWLALQRQYDLWHASEPATSWTLTYRGLETSLRAA
jgi:antitoxin HigA-1